MQSGPAGTNFFGPQGLGGVPGRFNGNPGSGSFSPGQPPQFPSGGGAFRSGRQGANTFAGANWDVLDPQLITYLEGQRGLDRFLVATMTSSYASVFILASNAPALALGGYQGWDRIYTPTQLPQLVASHTVRFFYISSSAAGSFAPGNATSLDSTNADLATWIRTNCTAVATSLWQSTTTSAQRGGGMQLYDCMGSR